MPSLIWSPAALEDVDRHYRFLAGKNRPAAKRAIGTIRRSVQLLKQHPSAGRTVEGRAPEFREWPIDFGSAGYVALYRYENDSVTVIGVRHGREAGY